MKNKPRCKQCRKIIQEAEITQQLPLNAQVHVKDCLDKYVKSQLNKVRKRRKNVDSDMKKAKAENKRGKAKKTAWDYFSLYIRLRDADEDKYCHCITCGARRHWKDFIDAGHFVPKSTGEYFYFNEDNVHAQCRDCNGFKGGKRDIYKVELIKKIGKAKVEELERLEKERPILKRTLEDYEKLKKKYLKKFKELEKT